MSATDRLHRLVADCAAAGIARQALVFRMDRLPASLARSHHQRLAEAALSPLLACSRAELFQLPGPRLVVTWRGEAEAALMDVVDGLFHLLADTPVSAPHLRDLVFIYDLPDGGDLLLDTLDDAADGPASPATPSEPLDPSSLMLLEATLAQADLSRFARRDIIWRLGPESPVVALERRTLSLPELGAALLPGRDLAGDPWLWRRLTRTLDRRTLALLASPGELAMARPFVLDLNVSSVLGPEFLRFDAALPTALRGQVVLAFAPEDVAADAAAYTFARGFVRARQYRVMLRDATPGVLAVLCAPALEVDYVMAPWSPSFIDGAGALLDLPPAMLVLACGAAPDAVAWARSAGIRLVAGSAVAASLGERADAT